MTFEIQLEYQKTIIVQNLNYLQSWKQWTDKIIWNRKLNYLNSVVLLQVIRCNYCNRRKTCNVSFELNTKRFGFFLVLEEKSNCRVFCWWFWYLVVVTVISSECTKCNALTVAYRWILVIHSHWCKYVRKNHEVLAFCTGKYGFLSSSGRSACLPRNILTLVRECFLAFRAHAAQNTFVGKCDDGGGSRCGV